MNKRKDVKTLERVQKRFTRMVTGMVGLQLRGANRGQDYFLWRSMRGGVAVFLNAAVRATNTLKLKYILRGVSVHLVFRFSAIDDAEGFCCLLTVFFTKAFVHFFLATQSAELFATLALFTPFTLIMSPSIMYPCPPWNLAATFVFAWFV